jgi:hypothetical protein
VIAKCKEVLHQKRNEKVQFTEVLHQLFNEKVQFTDRTIEDSNANEHLKAHSGFSCAVFLSAVYPPQDPDGPQQISSAL